MLLGQLFAIQLPTPWLFAIGVIASSYIAFRDIQLSAKTMLALEGVSLVFVLILGALIWSHKGFALDTSQLTLEGATPSGALAGVVLVVFGFSGFESATVLGEEAKNPLVTIPRSVLQSVLLAGLFFIATSYVAILGFQGTGMQLAESEAPLHTLASSLGWGGLGLLINIGILLSFFSCTLASINSTARILFAMAQDRLISDALGHAHVQNRTPHVAVGLSALVTFAVPLMSYAAGVTAFEAQGHFGTLCSFGFIVVYILISVASPVFLASSGKLTRQALASSIGGVAFMLLPLLGTVGIPGSQLFPTPDVSGLILVAIFSVYMALGLGWLLLRSVRSPQLMARLQSTLDSLHLQFPDAGEPALSPASNQSEAAPPMH